MYAQPNDPMTYLTIDQNSEGQMDTVAFMFSQFLDREPQFREVMKQVMLQKFVDYKMVNAVQVNYKHG